MNWNKNAFSYLFWVIYTAAVSVGILGLSASVCYIASFPMGYGFAAAVFFMTVIGLLVLFLHKIGKNIRMQKRNNTVLSFAAECLMVTVLVAAGLYLRVVFADGSAGHIIEGNIYYEAARVTGQSVPQVVHGATYLYLLLLRGVLLLFGNQTMAAAGTQIVLQVLAAIALYIAVRKLSGVAAGLIAMAFFMLSPCVFQEVCVLSPSMLLLFLYCVVLYLIAYSLKRDVLKPMLFFLDGIATGLVIYLDIFGVTLLFVLFSIITLSQKDFRVSVSGKIKLVLSSFVGSAAVFFGALAIDTLCSGAAFLKVINAWVINVKPTSFLLPYTMEVTGKLVDIILMLVLLSVGIFSFWCGKRTERQCIWILLAAAVIVLQGFGMQEQNTGSMIYLYIMLAVLAGVGVEAVFKNDVLQVAADVDICDAEINDSDIVFLPAEEICEQKPRFIENPLPLPKKHVSKVLDYPIKDIADNENDFDLDVSENDDFDVK